LKLVNQGSVVVWGEVRCDLIDEGLRIDGLAHIVTEALSQQPFAIADHRICGDRDDWNVPQRTLPFKPATNLHAIGPGKLNIAENQIGPLAPDGFNSLQATNRHEGFVTKGLQKIDHQV